jgi:hypothetical protein
MEISYGGSYFLDCFLARGCRFGELTRADQVPAMSWRATHRFCYEVYYSCFECWFGKKPGGLRLDIHWFHPE